jgi:hypothetical protein
LRVNVPAARIEALSLLQIGRRDWLRLQIQNLGRADYRLLQFIQSLPQPPLVACGGLWQLCLIALDGTENVLHRIAADFRARALGLLRQLCVDTVAKVGRDGGSGSSG